MGNNVHLGWRIFLWLANLMMTIWAALFIWLTIKNPSFRFLIVVFVSLGILLPPLLLYPRNRGFAVSAFFFSGLIIWFFSLAPSNDRNWQPDLRVLPWQETTGNTIKLHNIRNCNYRSETDFTCSYYDRTVNLSDLTTIDLYLVYWGSPHIAHTMVSFGFKDDVYICFSIETRKEIGEDYSAVKGFFRQYEKIYIMADERDVVRLRTNFRHEDVYLYRLLVKPEIIRNVFLDYLQEVNRLNKTPEWYNAILGNCTTSIRQHTMPYNPNARMDWRLIINGTLDKLIYERGFLNHGLSFTELKQRSYINRLAQEADSDLQFSRRIRSGLPGMPGGGPR